MEGRRGAGGPRVGVMGGTFDPIHIGHLLLAEEAGWQLGLDRVLFVPTGRPWQKLDEAVSDPEHRWAMTQLAVAGNRRFEGSRAEIDHPGPTYTVETLRRLRDALPDGSSIYMLTGADVALQLPTWKDPQGVLQLAELVVAGRPGWDLSRLGDLDAQVPGARVRTIAMPQVEVSATAIRERVAAGRPIRYLTPDPVVAYIAEHGLYRPAPAPGPAGRPGEPGPG